MDRLTYKKGEHYYTNDSCIVEVKSLSSNGADVLFDCIDKLGAYEDAEEQGLILKLPCKVGTPVYYVQKCTCPYSCEECGASRWLDNCYCDYKARIFEREFDYSHLNAFGKTVFLTKEEAEQALMK